MVVVTKRNSVLNSKSQVERANKLKKQKLANQEVFFYRPKISEISYEIVEIRRVG